MAQIKISALTTGTPKGGDMTPATDPTDLTQAPSGTTKKYIRSDELNFYLEAQGLTTYSAVVVATTAALTAVYANGALGVGATLTNSGAMAALTIDGVLQTSGNRVLVKDQAAPAQNGIYTVTTVGSGATNWVLTRATDYDQAADVIQFGVVLVNQGTVSAGLLYQETGAAPFTIGTTPIVFQLFAMPTVDTPTTDNAIARFNGAGGNLQNSGVLISDLDNVQMATSTGFQDLSSNYYLRFATLVTPTSNLVITQGDASGSPVLSVEGSQTDLGIRFQMKGTSAYLFQGTSTSEANINMQEQTTNGTDVISLSPPAALAATYSLTFPANVAAVNNEFLQSTTVGVLSWTGTEAQWTPVPRGSVTPGSPTGTFEGRYKIIGNRAIFSAQIIFTSLDTMAGNFIIGGFPFTIIANAANRNGIYTVFKGGMTNDFVVMGFGGAATTDINMYNAELGNTPMVIGDLSATATIYIAGIVIVS